MIKATTTVSALAASFLFFLSTGSALALYCDGIGSFERLEVRDPALFANLEDRAAQYRNPDGRFWRISRPGMPPSFIVGSDHYEKIDRGSPYFKALDQARVFFAEATDDADEVFKKELEDDPSLLQRENPIKLASFLPANLAEKITQKWIALGRKVEVLDYARPWYLYLELRSDYCDPDALNPESAGMDAALETYAREQRLEIRSAEVWIERLQALFALTEEPPHVLLYEAVNDRQPVSTFELVALLAEERVMLAVELLRHLIPEETEPSFPVEEAIAMRWEELIVKRNHAMLRNSISEFEAGGVFMVVGAMHLPTKDGLIALLEDQGFTATRVATQMAE